MSTALGIASVTHVLRDLLNNGLANQDGVGNVTVSTLPLDRLDPDVDDNQLNLFMYLVSYNQGWRNVAQPVLNRNGERLSNPPLAVDLHYLLTAYGATALQSEILLGFGMQALHETPFLGRDFIRDSLASSNIPALMTSGLAEQPEQIKIVPEPMGVEDISKLWTAFQTQYYRPSVAYRATVLLIESRRSVKPALPVRTRKLYVNPFAEPVIEKIMSRSAPGEPVVEGQKIFPGYALILSGSKLENDMVEVSIDGDSVTPLESISNTEIALVLPSGLVAGVHAIQVIHPRLMGSPPVPHRGVASIAEAFVLCPQIVAAAFDVNAGNIDINIVPAVDHKQKVTLLLNQVNVMNPRSYSFDMVPFSSGTTEDITIHITGVVPGTYLIRLQVDGAESALDTNSAGEYHSPTITVP